MTACESWALLAADHDDQLKFAVPAILNPPRALRAAWKEQMAELALAQAALELVEAEIGSVAEA